MSRSLAGILLAALALLSSTGASIDSQSTAEFNGLLWVLETNDADVPWRQANEYCEALEWAGRSDWRLPTFAELESLHDPAAADTTYRRIPVQSDTCCLWSSSTLEDKARDDDFYIGPRGSEEQYAWGYLFDEEGLAYYSSMGFPDGQALCVTDGD